MFFDLGNFTIYTIFILAESSSSILKSKIIIYTELIVLDIRECTFTTGTYPCHVNADCTDTFGSYICQCSDGFTGDGLMCNGNFLSFFGIHQQK